MAGHGSQVTIDPTKVSGFRQGGGAAFRPTTLAHASLSDHHSKSQRFEKCTVT